MQTRANQSLRGLIMIFLVLTLFTSFSSIRVTQAAVSVDFSAFNVNTPAESLSITGVSAMSSVPVNSTYIFDFTGTASTPFVGNGLLNTQIGGTLRIDFTQGQASYAFDYATNIGDGSDTFTIKGFRNAATDPVFVDNRAVTSTGIEQHSISVSSAVFDRLEISSTTQHWAIDNLATTDSATAGVTIIQTGGSTDVDEQGLTSDTYQLKLDTVPAANVVINLTSDAQCTVTPSVTFTGGSSAPQTVTVTAVDDSNSESTPHNCVITQTVDPASDENYTGVVIPNLIAHVTDNDTASLKLVETGGSTDYTEGGPHDTYSAVLTKAPLADVIVTVYPDAICDAGGGPGVVLTDTFTPSNWNIPKEDAWALAMNDFVAQGPHTCVLQHSLTSTNPIADPDYANVTGPDIIVHITDNDTAGVTITQSDGTTGFTEGGSDSYTIVLTSQPTADVRVTVTPGAQCSVGSGMGIARNFDFTGGAPSVISQGNWSTPQTVTVTADDFIDQGDYTCTITHTVTSDDSIYNGIAPTGTPVVASITDNDTAGVTIIQEGFITSFTEGGSDSYTIVLTSQPTASVTVRATPGALCAVGGALGAFQDFIFTAGNWNTAQTVTVTGDDPIDQGMGAHNCTINHAVTSGDSIYNGIAPTGTPVVASITDNDTAGVTINQTGGTTSFAEGGSDTYTIVLTSQPTASVTVRATPGALCAVGGALGAFQDFIFTAGNWNSPQTVTVSAVDDTLMQGARDCTINHAVTSGDSIYNGIAPSGTPVVAHITDNDPGVIITQSGGSTDVIEGGATDSYTLVLNTQPTHNVIVTVTPDTECSVGGATGAFQEFTFTTVNWNSSQTVTVTAADDSSYTVGNTCTIAHSVSSDDPAYNPSPILGTPVIAHITDNDISALNAVPKRNYIITHTPTLTWSPVTWAIRYELQVSSSSTFSAATTTTHALGNVLDFTISPALTNSGPYYWRVRACKSATSCGAYSPAEMFVVR